MSEQKHFREKLADLLYEGEPDMWGAGNPETVDLLLANLPLVMEAAREAGKARGWPHGVWELFGEFGDRK